MLSLQVPIFCRFVFFMSRFSVKQQSRVLFCTYINGCVQNSATNICLCTLYMVLTLARLGFILIFCMPDGVLLFLLDFFSPLHESVNGWFSFTCCHILPVNKSCFVIFICFIELILSFIWMFLLIIRILLLLIHKSYVLLVMSVKEAARQDSNCFEKVFIYQYREIPLPTV